MPRPRKKVKKVREHLEELKQLKKLREEQQQNGLHLVTVSCLCSSVYCQSTDSLLSLFISLLILLVILIICLRYLSLCR